MRTNSLADTGWALFLEGLAQNNPRLMERGCQLMASATRKPTRKDTA